MDKNQDTIHASVEPLNGKGQAFRQYLEDEGIMDYLTVEMLSLFNSGSPCNGLEIFKNNICAETMRKVKSDASKEAKLIIEAHQIENEALKYRVEYLETQNKKLSLQIEDMKKK